MIGVVWWTCVFFALVSGRIYDRCELASKLYRYGIDPENIPTWVCIAYHESRLDTAANNPSSGDHGIFQISELFWCGAGKACGVTCDKFRDEDITDDIRCVLQIHEEHSRFQSNGFMAWVVYPQHCTHNTKKYVVDCDYQLKDLPTNKLRTDFELDQYNETSRSFGSPRVEDLLPPYLTVNTFFRGKYGKVFDNNLEQRQSWVDYKFDNIDKLKLPVSGIFAIAEPSFVTTPKTIAITSTLKTTTTTYVPRIKTWRYIESDQFRRRMKSDGKSENNLEQYTLSDHIKDIFSTMLASPSITLTMSNNNITPSIPKAASSASLLTTKFAIVSPTPTYIQPTTTTPKPSQTTSTARTWSTWATRKPTSKSPQLTERITTSTSTTPWTSWRIWTTPSNRTTSTTTTTSPWSSWKSWENLATATTTTTQSNVTANLKSWANSWIWTTQSPVPTTSTISSTSWTSRPWRTLSNNLTTAKKPYVPVTRSTTIRSTSQTAATINASRVPSTTSRPITTYKSSIKSFVTFPDLSSITTARPTTTSKSAILSTTQSIFDFYLNPTQKSRVFSYKLPSNNSFVKLKIFSDGTTTHRP